MNLTPLALPRLAIGARPLLDGLAPEVFEELEGVADGAGLPFDAAWLVQCASTFAAAGDMESRYRSPFCTMFAVTGLRAGADDVLVGRNLDWDEPEEPVLLDVRPDAGHRFVQVGFSWNVGAFTGMNDAGVVVCAERVESQGTPSLDGPPVEFILRQILQSAASLEEALALLAEAKHLRGFHVLLAGPGEGARVVELGETSTVREPVEGVLLGILPDADGATEETQIRYARAAKLIESERIVAASEIEGFLADNASGPPGRGRILNEATRHSVVFEPKARRLHVAFPDDEGGLGEFSTLVLEEGQS